jgi:hypothetical protein
VKELLLTLHKMSLRQGSPPLLLYSFLTFGLSIARSAHQLPGLVHMQVVPPLSPCGAAAADAVVEKSCRRMAKSRMTDVNMFISDEVEIRELLVDRFAMRVEDYVLDILM